MIQQQQMMQQQMMIPPPMMMQPILNEQNNNFGKEPERYNVIFKPIFVSLPIINILAYEGMSIKELLDKYINSIKGKLNENEINELKFFSPTNMVGRLNREDYKRKVTSSFRNITIWVEKT